jgi:hypothetical protein
MPLRFATFALIALLLTPAFSEASRCSAPTCSDCSETIGNLRIFRIQSRSGVCMMKLDHARQGGSKRNFILNNYGELQVFHDEGGRKDAAQVTMFFTKGLAPRILSSQGNTITFLMGNGKKMIFDTSTALPINIEDCQIQVRASSSLSDPGFQVTSCKQAYAKTAYQYDPKVQARRMKLISSQKRSCEIATTDLFNVRKDEATWKFAGNSTVKAELENVVKKNPGCHNLGFDFSFLNQAPTPPNPAAHPDPLGDLLREKGLAPSKGAQ